MSVKRRARMGMGVALAVAIVFGVFGTTSAQQAQPGELSVWGPLVDKDGNEFAYFELGASEVSTIGFYYEGFEGEESEPYNPDFPWTLENVDLGRYAATELPEIGVGDGEYAMSLVPSGSPVQASLCLADGFEPTMVVDYEFLFYVAVDSSVAATVAWFDAEEPCNGEPIEPTIGGTFEGTGDWEHANFPVTVPDHDYANFPSALLVLGLDNDETTYVDEFNVYAQDPNPQPGVGELGFYLEGPSISACDTHGPSAEQGNEGILGQIGCYGSGGQAVEIRGCEATLETHGFVHSDAPNTTFLGQVVIDIALKADEKGKSGYWGELEVEIFTPKDSIVLEGFIPSPPEGEEFWMPTCFPPAP